MHSCIDREIYTVYMYSFTVHMLRLHPEQAITVSQIDRFGRPCWRTTHVRGQIGSPRARTFARWRLYVGPEVGALPSGSWRPGHRFCLGTGGGRKTTVH